MYNSERTEKGGLLFIPGIQESMAAGKADDDYPRSRNDVHLKNFGNPKGHASCCRSVTSTSLHMCSTGTESGHSTAPGQAPRKSLR